jgi:hypothetical protein
VRLDDGKFGKFSVRLDFGTSLHSSQTCPRRSGLANNHEQTQSCLQSAFIWRMSGKKSFTTATCQLHKGVAILRYVFRGLMYLNMSSGGLKQCSRTHSSTYAGSCSSADP